MWPIYRSGVRNTFYELSLWDNFRLADKLQKSTEFSLALPPASPGLHNRSTVTETRKQTWIKYYWVTYRPYLNFTRFSTTVLFLAQDWFSWRYHFSLYSEGLISQSFFVFHDLNTLGEFWSVCFVDCSPNWISQIFCHDFICVMHLAGIPQMWCFAFFRATYQGVYDFYVLLLGILTLSIWIRSYLLHFSTVNLCSPLYLINVLWEDTVRLYKCAVLHYVFSH